MSDNHNIKNINTSMLIKGSHGVVVSVYVSETGGNNATLNLRNGTNASAPIEFYVYAKAPFRMENINRRFENGIYAEKIGNNSEFIVVYK